jgi:hypothetical protein
VDRKEHSRYGVVILLGVVSSALYAGVATAANLLWAAGWPLPTWGGIVFLLLLLLLLWSRDRDSKRHTAHLSKIANQFAQQSDQLKTAEKENKKWEGIESATGLCEFEPQLDESDEHPRASLDRINISFLFMGNGGSKWTREEPKMRKMLEKVGNASREARMLLLDPDSDVCIEASKDQHQGNRSVEPIKIIRSLQCLHKLRADYPHLEFRLYDHTPFFRLVFVDGRVAIVGHYKQYHADSAYTPLVLWESHPGGWSFYWAFKKYFDAEWDAGQTITTEKLNSLAEKYGLNGL